jgi:radical SAM protein with 4Fe4S-binding SPASM domain
MNRGSSRHGLILRREIFGGIAFDACDGTQLELDAEAFGFLEQLVRTPELPDRGFARHFLKRLAGELPSLGKVSPRCFDFAESAPTQHPLEILASPTLVDFQITERCGQGCPHCYASSVEVGAEVSFADAQLALDRFSEAGVCQVALGGGDPLLHRSFVPVLHAIRERGMVPNVTTSGAYFSDENLAALKECCGAVALSLEAVGDEFGLRRRMGFEAFERGLLRLREARIPSVLQVTVSLGNLRAIDDIVEFALSRELYGVVFLAFKPAGRGRSFDEPLIRGETAAIADLLSRAFERLDPHTRVGYDCCFAPMIAALNVHAYGHNNSELEGCSATRGSVGVTPNLDVLPCTFLPERVLGNLREQSLVDIWRAQGCGLFRAEMERHANDSVRCRSCSRQWQCLGGCSQLPIARCSDD